MFGASLFHDISYDTVLKLLLLLLQKDASDVSKVSLHHCLAEIETTGGATKRQNVFRLTLANSSSAIYQARFFNLNFLICCDFISRAAVEVLKHPRLLFVAFVSVGLLNCFNLAWSRQLTEPKV